MSEKEDKSLWFDPVTDAIKCAPDKRGLFIRDAKAIYDDLDKYIGGHIEAKKYLSALAYMHYLRMSDLCGDPTRTPQMPLNCFITGPSGFGKTYLTQRLAKTLQMSYHRLDMTTITGAGWKGDNIDTALHKIAISSRSENTPCGLLLFLDEIDKRSWSDDDEDGGSGHGSSNTALQENLLDLLEGLTMYRELNAALIVMGGSFQKERNKRREASLKRSVGFQAEMDPQAEGHMEDFIDPSNWKEDLIKLGMLPEIVNRTLGFVGLGRLPKQEITDILLHKQDNAYQKYHELFGIELNYLEINELVDKIYDSEAGLREIDTYLFGKSIKEFEPT